MENVLAKSRHLYIFLYARSLLSSAVRLNLIGPYAGHKLLFELKEIVQNNVESTQDLTISEVCQTSPVLEILQGMHDRLYSKLFNS